MGKLKLNSVLVRNIISFSKSKFKERNLSFMYEKMSFDGSKLIIENQGCDFRRKFKFAFNF